MLVVRVGDLVVLEVEATDLVAREAVHAVVEELAVRHDGVVAVDAEEAAGAPCEGVTIEGDVGRAHHGRGVGAALEHGAPVLEAEAADGGARRGRADRERACLCRDLDGVARGVVEEVDLLVGVVDVERARGERGRARHLRERRAVDEHLLGQTCGRVAGGELLRGVTVVAETRGVGRRPVVRSLRERRRDHRALHPHLLVRVGLDRDLALDRTERPAIHAAAHDDRAAGRRYRQRLGDRGERCRERTGVGIASGVRHVERAGGDRVVRGGDRLDLVGRGRAVGGGVRRLLAHEPDDSGGGRRDRGGGAHQTAGARPGPGTRACGATVAAGPGRGGERGTVEHWAGFSVAAGAVRRPAALCTFSTFCECWVSTAAQRTLSRR